MANPRKWYIPAPEAAYLKSEIECGVAARSKRALQTLCKHYRQNGFIGPREINGLEHAILGALMSGKSDEKVRRWSLTAISLFGREDACWGAVNFTLQNVMAEPQAASAAIAALFKLNSRKAEGVIKQQNFVSPEILALSAMQTVSWTNQQLPKIELNIDVAEAELLKLALILVGIDKCPPNLLHPRHSNGAIVKALGGHHDDLVSQYSAWAAAENPNLSAKDLGIDPRGIDGLPDNVRSYVYRLYASEKVASTLQHEIICRAQIDSSVDARLGAAIGLRGTYYNGLADPTLDWLYAEPDDEVRASIVDHIVTNVDKCDDYRRTALELYVYEENDGAARRRMEAAAARTTIYKDFKRILHEQEEGFLGGVTVNHNNTFINNGSLQGQISQSGHAENSGTQTNQLAANPERARHVLEEALRTINGIPVEEALKIEIQEAVEEAKAAPVKDKVDRVLNLLKSAKDATEAVAGTAGSVLAIGTSIASIAGLF